MQTIAFYYGLGSRYSYLAFTQIERIESEYGCRFDLHPISSIDLMQLCGPSPFEGRPVSGQYDWGYREADAAAWAKYYDVPFREPKPLPEDHRLMAKACQAASLQGELRSFSKALFAAVFADHKKIDFDVCVGLASGIGLAGERFVRDLSSHEVSHAVSAGAKNALDRGAFGVPTFFAGKEMFWGNDRLVLLEHHLKASRI